MHSIGVLIEYFHSFDFGFLMIKENLDVKVPDEVEIDFELVISNVHYEFAFVEKPLNLRFQ